MPHGQARGPCHHFTLMRHCCGQVTCYKNFLGLGDRLTNSNNWELLLDFFHDNKEGELNNSIPGGYKWQDFIFDFWDFKQEQKFHNHFTTSLEVNWGGGLRTKYFVTGESVKSTRRGTCDKT